jgi:cell division protein FtsB
MIAPWGYSFWVWLKSNPLAQWLLAIAAAWIAFRIWLATKVQAVRKDEQQKIEIKAQETAREVIDKAKDKTNETIRKAEDARADIPRGTPSGELPERVQDALFDD